KKMILIRKLRSSVGCYMLACRANTDPTSVSASVFAVIWSSAPALRLGTRTEAKTKSRFYFRSELQF
ncbi:hypothetical protein ACPF4W_003321, partial [Vibrio cholerae]